MYITSPALLSQIDRIANTVRTESHGSILFEEYIALPHYGQIVLRFDLQRETFSLAELDAYESLLYQAAGDDYLIDFMGSVYRTLGVDYTRTDDLLRHCNRVFADEPIFPSIHADALRTDACHLLRLCGMDPTLPVWEIQMEDPLRLLLFGEQNASIGAFPVNNTTIRVSTADELACAGLTKAAFYAKRTGLSLARAMLLAQQTLPTAQGEEYVVLRPNTSED